MNNLESAWLGGPYDLVFFPFVLAAQFAAIALWLRRFRPNEAPFVAICFDTTSGNNVNDHHRYYTPYYRKAGKSFRKEYLPRTLLFTYDPAITSDYAELTKLPIRTMPAVHTGFGEPRVRKRELDGRITVAFLGHQRVEKGYHLIPEIARRVGSKGLPVRLLVHNSATDDSAASRELRALARELAYFTFIEEPSDHLQWQNLIDRSDLIVLPYEPNRYRQSGSGVATEAVGSGVPMVVPSGTTMEALAVQYQGCASAFSNWTAEAVTNAIEQAVANFDVLAKQAEAGALEWRRSNGVGQFVDSLLEIVPHNGRPPAVKPARRTIRDVMMDWVLDSILSLGVR